MCMCVCVSSFFPYLSLSRTHSLTNALYAFGVGVWCVISVFVGLDEDLSVDVGMSVGMGIGVDVAADVVWGWMWAVRRYTDC